MITRSALPPKVLLMVVAVLLAGCASAGWQWPWQAQQVISRQPAPPQVVGSCPPALVQQSRWLMRNLPRVRLGSTKLETTGILGQPARAESFMLTDGTMVEVLFYHTASTVCRRPDLDGGLMPFVYQNNRLLGYGQNYYHDFIVPSLRRIPRSSSLAPVQTPDMLADEGADMPPVTTRLPPSLARGYAGQPDVDAENLAPMTEAYAPSQPTYLPVSTDAPYQRRQSATQAPPERHQSATEASLYDSPYAPARPQPQLGRGQPLY